LANSPLELHINAAAITQSRPRNLPEGEFMAGDTDGRG
jgi:hypothetical protein